MLSRIQSDRILLGHSLVNIPSLVWDFSKSETLSQKTSHRFVELVARRVLAPFIALITTVTLLPIGFATKILHHSVRSFSCSFFPRASLASLALASPMVVTFQSPEQLQRVLLPHSIEEVESCIASSSIPLIFQYNADSSNGNKVLPIRNYGTGNLLKHSVFQSNQLSIYYPESPRVPHHLTIALNRSNVNGITDVSEEENQAIFACIRKIAEIYKRVNVTGFVIAQYDNPQQGHSNRYVVEIIPHLPGFNNIKNIADKVDCNRYVLFRQANISPVICTVAQENIEANAHFWKQAFEQETSPLIAEDLNITFPHTRYESHEQEAQKILRQHLIEILQDRGGQTEPTLSSAPIPMPMERPDSPKSIEVSRCFFCDPAIIQKQRVFEYNNVEVLYNVRKGAKSGCAFLIIPKSHKEKVYGLSQDEISNISIVRKALVEVLKESHPGHEVITYIQDDPAIGQTVFHSHEQVVAVNPDTIALSWTLMSLYPQGNVSEEEMRQVKEEFEKKMRQKIQQLSELEEVI